jgi:hypothetical protein
MPRWHRIIVVLLLVTFTPASVFAAMPLVWCMGQDGHRAVEYKASRSHVAHVAVGSKYDDVAQVVSEDKGHGCHDRQVIDKAKTAKAPTDGLLPFSLRNVIELRTLPGKVATASKLSPPACTDKCPAPNPERAARRSVVLLI